MSITVHKTFSYSDYKDNDRAYKALFVHFDYLYPVLRKEDYGIDVDVYLNKKSFEKNCSPIAKLELEVKHNWEGDKFPFSDVQFLAKKQKHSIQNTLAFWVLFNSSCTNCSIIPMTKILKGELIMVNCNGIGNDLFYRIPVSEFLFGIEKIESYLIEFAFKSLNSQYRLLFK